MEKYPHPTWIEIDVARFQKNLRVIRKHIGKSRFCLPVKANAYGHGLIGIGKCAANQVDCLGVSCLQEGIALRQAGMTLPIIVLGAIHEDQVDDLVQFNLEFSISSKFKADLVAKRLHAYRAQEGLTCYDRARQSPIDSNDEPHSRFGKGEEESRLDKAAAGQNISIMTERSIKCRVHLEVETGMQRTGVRCSTAIQLIQYLKTLPCFEVVGVYSHFATADLPNDPFALQQIAAFQELIRHPPFQGLSAHMANSGGVVHYPQSHLDMVRPGLMAYGYPPPYSPPSFQELTPCFSLKSKVSYFKVVPSGSGISYGHAYTTQKETRIVTVPVGYGDGYRRALSTRGAVLIRGIRFPIAGAICMDQFMVDVGDAEVYVGDEVVLIGRQGDQEITLTEIAHICDTIPYEVLCQFNERIPRFFI